MGLEIPRYPPTCATAALRTLQPMASAGGLVSDAQVSPIVVTARHSVKQQDSSAHVAVAAVVADVDARWVFRPHEVNARALVEAAQGVPRLESSYSAHEPGQENPHMGSADSHARTTVGTAQADTDGPSGKATELPLEVLFGPHSRSEEEGAAVPTQETRSASAFPVAPETQ